VFVAPDGNTVADNLIYDFATPAIAKAEQTITVSASTSYTFSCWVRSPSGIASAKVEFENSSTAVNYATNTVTVGTNWTRISCIGTIPVGVTSIKVRVSETTTNNLVVWGAQLEAGFAASSYIPTTTTSATRRADLAGLVSPHNLAIQSEDLSSATGTAWSSFSKWTSRTIVSAATSPSPNGTGGVTRLISDGTVTSGNIAFCRQTIRTSSSTIYTFSIWLKGTTTGTAFIAIRNAAAGGLGSTTCSITTSWQRFFVTISTATANDSIIIDLNTQTATQTIDAFGAQLTEGYLPGRYIRTTDTQVLPVQMVDPSWSQNGYIEADIIWTSRTGSTNLTHFGDGISLTSTGTIIFTTAGTTLRFGRYDSSATLRSASIVNATVYNAGSARVRMEWTNYLLGGSRYMFLRLYLNGTLQIETNFAGTSGTSWPVVDVTRFARLQDTTGQSSTISNLILGTPSLPSGATPSGL
jgi:hypothetical protein